MSSPSRGWQGVLGSPRRVALDVCGRQPKTMPCSPLSCIYTYRRHLRCERHSCPHHFSSCSDACAWPLPPQVCSARDPYPAELWGEAASYFESLDGNEILLPGGRYACAQDLTWKGVLLCLVLCAEMGRGQSQHASCSKSTRSPSGNQTSGKLQGYCRGLCSISGRDLSVAAARVPWAAPAEQAWRGVRSRFPPAADRAAARARSAARSWSRAA